MTLKTIELELLSDSYNKRLVKKIYKLDLYYFHFFYEPQLIVRVSDTDESKVISYLKKRHIKYEIYDYPNGKGFRESKKGVSYKYSVYLSLLYYLNSKHVAERDKKDDYKILERYTHTFMNQMGYHWIDEVVFLLCLARGRTGTIRKREARTLLEKFWCTAIIWVINVSIKMSILFKYESPTSHKKLH
jgi:hypothetical protein